MMIAIRRRRPRRGWAGRAAVAVGALAVCGLLATGCSHSSSGPGVAQASSSPASGSSSPSGGGSSHGSAYDQALAYAQCMRSHGISDFPDPDSSGQIDIKGLHPGPTSDLNADNPQFQAAHRACQSLQPTVSSSQQGGDAAQALKWSQCFRAHGITNFPDPDSTGRINVGALRSAGIDFNAPQVQAAAKACQKYQPNSIHVPGGTES
jgi:hypothetical protein